MGDSWKYLDLDALFNCDVESFENQANHLPKLLGRMKILRNLRRDFEVRFQRECYCSDYAPKSRRPSNMRSWLSARYDYSVAGLSDLEAQSFKKQASSSALNLLCCFAPFVHPTKYISIQDIWCLFEISLSTHCNKELVSKKVLDMIYNTVLGPRSGVTDELRSKFRKECNEHLAKSSLGTQHNQSSTPRPSQTTHPAASHSRNTNVMSISSIVLPNKFDGISHSQSIYISIESLCSFLEKHIGRYTIIKPDGIRMSITPNVNEIVPWWSYDASDTKKELPNIGVYLSSLDDLIRWAEEHNRELLNLQMEDFCTYMKSRYGQGERWISLILDHDMQRPVLVFDYIRIQPELATFTLMMRDVKPLIRDRL
ncbi:hypothetical protein B7494_g6871 [Chlorociboria aeruginascens]|nr:hypothetical protein B7494_g6871 [Chlorociboria aeruginascens]